MTPELATFVAEAEEQGSISESALEAIALVHDLDEDELGALRSELEELGVAIHDAGEADASPDEEPELDLSLDLGSGSLPDSLTLFMNDIGRFPLLTASQEVELAKRIERGDQAAKERMINSNLRLVVHNARRYNGHGVPLGDLVQEGIIGLNRAVEKFDWRKGYKFSTYATWWIRQACQRAISNQSKTIRIPVHVNERRAKLGRLRQRFEAQYGREPTVEELAKAAGIEVEHAYEALAAVEASVSLNQSVGDDDSELSDLFGDPEASDPAELANDSLRSDAVREALLRLPERERRVVELRFGFEGETFTLEAIGRELGIARERVRQIEQQALAKLGRELEKSVDPEELARAA
ncbi:MAG: sigma-70 family RNA polymerase sigma factor [Gaiellaceae bacterium]